MRGRKCFGILLAFVLVLGLIPLSAIPAAAAEGESGLRIEITLPEVRCGDPYGPEAVTDVSVSESDAYEVFGVYWATEDPDVPSGYSAAMEEGTFRGGDTAAVLVMLDVFAGEAEPEITVNGGTLIAYDLLVEEGTLDIVATTAVAHVPGETTVENERAPSCEEAGSRDEVLRCAGCGEEIGRETEEIPATGHDWGEWEVTREATATEAGERQRVCKNDPDHVETEEIPAAGTEPEGPAEQPGETPAEEPGETPAATSTLTFDLGGGTLNGSADPLVLEAEVGSEITIPDAPVREGYKFLYWEGSEYHPGDKYLVTAENHTFTAKWEATSIPGIPSTGDESQTTLWGVLMIGSALGLILLAITDRKRGTHEMR